MTLTPEAKWPRKDRNRKQRRTAKQQDKIITAAVAALGAGTVDDWPQDDTRKRRKPREMGE